MAIMKQEVNAGYYYAVLKLIEQLYKDGKISKHVFQNILNDYANAVDISAFVDYETKEDSA